MRKAIVLSVLGAVLSVGIAFAADEAPTAPGRDREDAQFYCVFRDELKKGGTCEVFGQFDKCKKPGRHEVVRGDRDDFLKVVCKDCDGDFEKVIYNDGIEWLLRRDSDDSRHTVDTEFRGLHNQPSILIEDLNWKDVDGHYRATLSFEKRHSGEFVRLHGQCQIREKDEHRRPRQ